MKNAVIYCRVSSNKQVKEGHGLSSQEANCRKYAEEHGFKIQRVFNDDYTGGGDFWHRPGLKELLAYLDEQNDEFAVIFDDLKRFARDTFFHLKLRKELSQRNAYPRCPNFRFEDTPEGEFVETIIAATGELERKQNRRQVISRMKARLEAGHWVFAAPVGYKHVSTKREKKIVLDHPVCESVKEALEGYATGKLGTQREVEAFLKTRSCISRWSNGKSFSRSAIRSFLSNEFYSGWCVSSKWSIRVQGIHEPLISDRTHRLILKRLRQRTPVYERKDVQRDFPLRGFVLCASCGRPLTSGWTQGRSAKYPYYRCQTKGCIGSILKSRMEDRFLERLEDGAATPGLYRVFEKVILEVFQDSEKLQEQRAKANQERLVQIEQDIKTLVDSVTRAKDSGVQRIYEERISTLQEELETLRDPDSEQIPDFEIEPVLDRGRDYLRFPVRTWKTGSPQQQGAVQKLAFQHRIRYCRDSAFCTAELSPIYAAFEAAKRGDSSLVDLLGPDLNPVAEELRRWTKAFKTFSV